MTTNLQINRQTVTFTQIENAFKNDTNFDTGLRLKGNDLSNKSHFLLPERAAKAEAKQLLLQAVKNEYPAAVYDALKNTSLFAGGGKITVGHLEDIRDFLDSMSIGMSKVKENFENSKKTLDDHGVNVLKNDGKVSTTTAGGGGILFVHNSSNEKVGVIKPVDHEELQQTLRFQKFYEGVLENSMSPPFGFPPVKHISNQEDRQKVVDCIEIAKKDLKESEVKDKPKIEQRLSGFANNIKGGEKELMQMDLVKGQPVKEMTIRDHEDIDKAKLAMFNLGKTSPFSALFGLRDHTAGERINLENIIITPKGEFSMIDPNVVGETKGKPGYSAQELRALFREMAELSSMDHQEIKSHIQSYLDEGEGLFNKESKQGHSFGIINLLMMEANSCRSSNKDYIGNMNSEVKAHILADFAIGMYEGMREIAANQDGIAKALTDFNSNAGEYALHRNDEGEPMTGAQFMEIFNEAFNRIDHKEASSRRAEQIN